MADTRRAEKLAAARKKEDLREIFLEAVKCQLTPHFYHDYEKKVSGTHILKHSSLKKFQEKSNKSTIKNYVSNIENKPVTLSSEDNIERTIKETSSKTESQDQENSATSNNLVINTVLDENSHHTNRLSDSHSSRSISSTENIRQISMQLNGIMSQTCDFVNGETETQSEVSLSQLELERRNQELAADLENQKQVNEQSTAQIKELKSQHSKLQQQLQKQKEEFEERHFKEQGSLKEQLQVHIQTIGILVAEKTELQSSLSQSQQTAKQKAAEVEELQGRLKASRQRVSDLEREFSNINMSSQQLEKTNKEQSKEVDRLKLEIYKNNKLLEETKLQNSELTEKLNVKSSACENLEKELEEVQGKLSRAEIYVQQLTGDNEDEGKQLLEDLHNEKTELEKKVSQFKEAMHKLSQERDELAEQYQQFTQQLNQQVQTLSQQVSALNEEKSTVITEKSKLETRILELEDKLSESSRQTNNKTSNIISIAEVAEVKAALQKVEEEKISITTEYQKQMEDNNQLSHLIEERELQIQELQSSISRLQQDQLDWTQLRDEMQSDKIAASRAISQNRELKKQLEELQNGFIVMSNNKLELVEKLESEQHISKELSERLTQQEDELREIKKQVDEKEHDIEMLQKNSTELTKQMYQQQQIVDRVRHYEAQGQLTDRLQQELNRALEKVKALTSQNSELRTMLAQQAQQTTPADTNSTEGREMAKKDDLVASLSASVQQLEKERDQLLHQLKEQQGQREAFRAQLKELDHEGETNGIILSEQYENLKQNMQQLEDRFTKTMREIADLSDQKQQLEHLVLQLQGETDTIGEYIALYQVQRNVLKQRALEKDQYIAQLARDREEMKTKLSELQNLVLRLLYERQQYQLNGGDADITMNANILKPPGKAILNIPEKDLVAVESNGHSDTESKNENLPSFANQPLQNQTDTTAKKIIELISEIGSSSFIEKTVSDNFHPCPVCSGKLMTV